VIFDVFICCHPKDRHKLPHVVRCIRKYVPQAQQIHVSMPAHQQVLTEMPVLDGVRYHYDQEVLDIPHECKFRPNWVYQQMLKLFQRVTSDWYLVVDCDMFIVAPLVFQKPTFLLWRDQHNTAYYEFSERMFGFGREYPHSFIADMMVFNRQYICEMVGLKFKDQDDFIREAYTVMDGRCQISEYECYGNFMAKYHPDDYDHVRVIGEYCGRSKNDCNDEYEFSSKEIEKMVARAEASGLQLYAIHSWI